MNRRYKACRVKYLLKIRKSRAYQSRDHDDRLVSQIRIAVAGARRHICRGRRYRNVYPGPRAPRAGHSQPVFRQVEQLQLHVGPESLLVEPDSAGEPFEVFLQKRARFYALAVVEYSEKSCR